MEIFTWPNFLAIVIGVPVSLVVLAFTIRVLVRNAADVYFDEKTKFSARWFAMLQVFSQNVLKGNSNSKGDEDAQDK